LDRDSVSIRLQVPKDKESEFYRLILDHADLVPSFEIPYAYPNRQIFISYRRDDSEDVCGRIYDRLDSAFSNVFKDTEGIPPGVDFRFELERAVAACDVMLVVMGKRWDNAKHRRRLNDPDDFVRIEIEAALKREIPVIPVFVHRRTHMPDRANVPAGATGTPRPRFSPRSGRADSGYSGNFRSNYGVNPYPHTSPLHTMERASL
jgi:hypothetical protein